MSNKPPQQDKYEEQHESNYQFEEMMHNFFNLFNWETTVVVALSLCALSMYAHGVFDGVFDLTFYLILLVAIAIVVSWVYWKCVARPSQYYALPSQLR